MFSKGLNGCLHKASSWVPGNMCPQQMEDVLEAFKPMILPTFTASEDCLYLDVVTPNLKGKRDVLVFIHGGGFYFGKHRADVWMNGRVQYRVSGPNLKEVLRFITSKLQEQNLILFLF